MKSRLAVAATVVLSVVALAAPAAATDGAVTFHFASYSPASSRITPGGSVTFTPDAGNDFSIATANSAHHPLYFDDPSVGNVTSGSAPVTKTFASAGVYTYYCYFHASFGMKGKITVTNNQLPTASFTVALTGMNVSFDASASRDPDGAITKYQWDFNNDGTVDETDTTPTAQHTFNASATVALTVLDNNADAVGPEASAPATQSVAVAAPLPPVTAPTTPTPPSGDKIKPKVALVTKALHLAALRRGTAKLSFTVSERGSASATAKIGSTTVASGKTKFSRAGKVSVTLKPTKAGRAKLRHAHRATVKLSLTVTDAAGNRSTKSLTLKRVS